MKGWIAYLWQALAAMDDDALLYPARAGRDEAPAGRRVDVNDKAAVRTAFEDIVTREWGTRP
jgi:hypothetical protein